MGTFALGPDLTGVVTTQGLVDQYRVQTSKPAADAPVMYADVMQPGNKAKDIGPRLVTNASGVWTKTYPVGFWKSEPVIQVTPAMPLGNGVYLPILGKTQNADTSWTLSVTFYKINPTVTIAVLGTQTVVQQAGQVWFDLTVSESAM